MEANGEIHSTGKREGSGKIERNMKSGLASNEL